MERQEIVESAYQHGKELNLDNPSYRSTVISYLAGLLHSDIGIKDITTTAVVNPKQKAKAVIQTEEPGMIAGVDELCLYYSQYGIQPTKHLKDGSLARENADIITLEGNAQTILALERTALNIIRRMSGIATITNRYRSALQDYQTRIAATRKTSIKSELEKKAVYLGGGLTHRMSLNDAFMIKDCHLDLLKAEGVGNPITAAIERACASGHNRPLEIEVRNGDEAIEAAEAFYKRNPFSGMIPIIMFDNMAPEQINSSLEGIKHQGIYNNILFEASGGINLNTVIEYAKTGVDVVSTSEITERAKTLNIKQEIVG